MNKDWKTTIWGIVAATATGLLHNSTGLPHWVLSIADVLQVVSLAGLGIHAADKKSDASSSSSAGKTVSTLLMVFFLSLATLVLMTLPGCASSPARIAYNVENSAQVTVSAAMGAWGDYVAQNHPPAAQEQKVKDAYEKYQATLTAVIDATTLAINLAAANGGTNNPSAWGGVDIAQAQATAALTDLVTLVRTFGANIK